MWREEGFTIHGESYLDTVCHVLGEIRRAKTEAKVSQKALVEHVAVTATQAQIDVLTAGWADIADAGSVASWSATPDEEATDISVSVTLAAVSP